MTFKQGTCRSCGETETPLWNQKCIECADYSDHPPDKELDDMFKNKPVAYPPTTGNPLLKEHTMTSKFKYILPPALLILGMGLFVVIRAVVVAANPMANGIIAIPDWEHGVLICGDNATEEPSEPIKFHAGGDNGLIWSDAFGTWTVNEGHMNDIQLYKLKAVAKFTCPLNRGGWAASHNHFITNNGYDVSLYGVQDSDEGKEEEGFMVTDDQGVQDHTFECDGDFNVILVKN